MTSFFYQQYFFIFLFFFISILLSFIIFSLSYILAIHKPDNEKLSSYKCGFDTYEYARQAFDIRFYLVSILFIMFDLEAMYLFPWVISLNQIYLSGFWLLSFISIYSYMHVFFHLLI